MIDITLSSFVPKWQTTEEADCGKGCYERAVYSWICNSAEVVAEVAKEERGYGLSNSNSEEVSAHHIALLTW